MASEPAAPGTTQAPASRSSVLDPHWNHNTHYHRVIPRVARPPYGRVLDVGCGDGLLTRRLAPESTTVTGIDTSAEMIEVARRQAGSERLSYVHGDVLATDLPGPYDLVTCFATLHHMDLEAGLTRLRDLTARGGTLVVVGLANPSAPGDWFMGGVGMVASRWAGWRRRALPSAGSWDPGAPTADSTTTHGEVRAAARRLLPGAASVRHGVYWRYLLVWRAPGP